MADFVIQATRSNLVVPSILAVVAWVVQRQVRSASLSSLLWALVLIKLITSPLVPIPVLEVPSVSSSGVLPAGLSSGLAPPMGLGGADFGTRADASEDSWAWTGDATRTSTFAAIGMRNVRALLVVWLAGNRSRARKLPPMILAHIGQFAASATVTKRNDSHSLSCS